MIVSFDLFGTLVDVEKPADPGGAVAAELTARGVTVPEDWAAVYHAWYVDIPEGAELPLPEHVAAALRSRDIDPPRAVVREAVLAAFDPGTVAVRPGAAEAIEAAASMGTVGVLSNCSVPELVPRTLRRSGLDTGRIDAVVSSVECGWRKPDWRAFETVADRLGGSVHELVHVGDDARTDGGADDAGAQIVLLSETPLADLPAHLEAWG